MAGSLDMRQGSRRGRPHAPEPPLRLTRRGRGVLIGFAASALLVAFWLTAGPGARAGDTRPAPPGPAGRAQTVVVEPGETLWDIAARDDPEGDPRVTVRRIADLNGLPDSIVQPGQRLLVPAR